MGLQPDTLNSPEMKTAGIILLLATTCLAAPSSDYSDYADYYSENSNHPDYYLENSNYPDYYSDKALIMTGGYYDWKNGTTRLSSVEVFHPGTNTSCTLPSLPEEIGGHSQT